MDENEEEEAKSVNSEVSGVPWYLYDGEANAQQGIKVDVSRRNELENLKPSMPGPCSDDYICLLLRFATKSHILRKKRITIEKLYGCPVLFIGAENSDS